MSKKKALIANPSTVKSDLSKRSDSEHYKEIHITKLIDSMNVWFDDHPEAKEIQEFYNAHFIPSRTYYGLLERWPDLREAHERTMERLGGRLWSRCVDFKANWNPVKFMLHRYSPDYAQAKEHDAMLAAKAKENQEHTGPQFIVLEKFPDSPMVPMRKVE